MSSALLRLAMMLLLHTTAAQRCQHNAQCSDACTKVMGNSTQCRNVTCNSAYHQCSCSGAAALRLDGSCSGGNLQTVLTGKVCKSPLYDVWFTAATRASTVIRPEGFADGKIPSSSPLASILMSSAAAAVAGVRVQDLALSEMHIKLYGDAQPVTANTAEAPTLLFDFGFKFCALDGSNDSQLVLEAQAFEKMFSSAAQEYQAFYPSTMRLLHFEAESSDVSKNISAEHQQRVGASKLASNPVAASSDASAEWPATASVFWLAGAVLGCVLCSSVSFLLWQRCQPTEGQVEACTVQEFNKEDGDAAAMVTEPAALKFRASIATAYVITPFDAAEAAKVDEVWANCLTIAAGDMVDVHASTGLWLYGCIHGQPEKVGFVHESNIAWIGQTLPTQLPGEVCELDAVSTTTSCDMQDNASETPPSCFSVEVDELV